MLRSSAHARAAPIFRVRFPRASTLRAIATFTITATPSTQDLTPRSDPPSLTQLLLRAKTQFPETRAANDYLHARIDLLLSRDPVLRVAVVPLPGTPRAAIRHALDAVLADPLSSSQDWQTAVRNRNLSKNTLVRYAPAFDGGAPITHNSIVEYNVPFAVPKEGLTGSSATEEELNSALAAAAPKVAIVEVTSATDSLDHLLRCHRLVYLTNDAKDAELAQRWPDKYLEPGTEILPTKYVIDYGYDKRKFTADSTIAALDFPVISSETATKANDLLKASPADNADEYIALHNCANIGALNRALFVYSKKNDDKVAPRDIANLENAQRELAEGVLVTVQRIVGQQEATTEAIAAEGAEMARRRAQWAAEAHAELQTTLSTHLDALFNAKGAVIKQLKKKDEESPVALQTVESIPWYKLYWKVDEVYDIVDKVFLRYYFLPRAEDRYKYLQGRIDQFADLHQFPSAQEVQQHSTESSITTLPDVTPQKQEPVQLDIFGRARREVLETAGAQLHNSALRALLTTVIGIQLPLVVVPLGAVYALDYCTLYEAGSVMALGLVVGASRLQRAWARAAAVFKAAVAEAARVTVAGAERELWRKWEGRVEQQKLVTERRKKTVAELAKALN